MNEITDQLFGNYRLVDLLDRGSQASIYLGEHIYLHNKAAVVVYLRTPSRVLCTGK